MDIAAYIALIIFLSYLLVHSADLVEDSFVILSRKLKVSSFVMGFIVLSAASSLPEVSIAITSAINKTPELSIGNLLGASIVLVTLVLGLNAVRNKKLPFHGSFGPTQVALSMALLGLQIMALVDQTITFGEGVWLTAAYVLFALYVSLNGFKSKSIRKHGRKIPHKTDMRMVLAKSVIGIVGLIFFSTQVVNASIHLAKDLLGISEALIGILLLAIGTNLPEITVLARSRDLESKKLAVGNFLGSACLNVGTLGLLALMSPHRIIEFGAISPALFFFGIALVLFSFYALVIMSNIRNPLFN